jgi:hypothetical protein
LIPSPCLKGKGDHQQPNNKMTQPLNLLHIKRGKALKDMIGQHPQFVNLLRPTNDLKFTSTEWGYIFDRFPRQTLNIFKYWYVIKKPIPKHPKTKVIKWLSNNPSYVRHLGMEFVLDIWENVGYHLPIELLKKSHFIKKRARYSLMFLQEHLTDSQIKTLMKNWPNIALKVCPARLKYALPDIFNTQVNSYRGDALLYAWRHLTKPQVYEFMKEDPFSAWVSGVLKYLDPYSKAYCEKKFKTILTRGFSV